MAAKDFYHFHVKNALLKDGWNVTDDPFPIKWLGTTLQVDFGAEKIFAAEKDGRKIAVEVKSFIGASKIDDLKDAVGQFILYRSALKTTFPERELFLALRDTAYANTFEHPEGEILRIEENIKIIIFNAETQEIVQWIS
jgi:XisH protein